MLYIVRKIFNVRRGNEAKIWICHSVTAFIFFAMHCISPNAITITPTILSLFYFFICIYFTLNVKSKIRIGNSIYFVWVIVVHSLYFIGILLKESAPIYSAILMIVNILLGVFLLYRTELPAA